LPPWLIGETVYEGRREGDRIREDKIPRERLNPFAEARDEFGTETEREVKIQRERSSPFAEARDEFGNGTEEFSGVREIRERNHFSQGYRHQEFVREEVSQSSRENGGQLEQSFERISFKDVKPEHSIPNCRNGDWGNISNNRGIGIRHGPSIRGKNLRKSRDTKRKMRNGEDISSIRRWRWKPSTRRFGNENGNNQSW
jgi:hypothetical protein